MLNMELTITKSPIPFRRRVRMVIWSPDKFDADKDVTVGIWGTKKARARVLSIVALAHLSENIGEVEIGDINVKDNL